MRLPLTHGHQRAITACAAYTRRWSSLDVAFNRMRSPLVRHLLHAEAASACGSLYRRVATTGCDCCVYDRPSARPRRSLAWVALCAATIATLSFCGAYILPQANLAKHNKIAMSFDGAQ
ncbi:hypothetical protein BHM03_00058792 [Ensete ventricosum]|nr:hypothetical protein BHM03_00058792 [Ensete ventricosum]